MAIVKSPRTSLVLPLRVNVSCLLLVKMHTARKTELFINRADTHVK